MLHICYIYVLSRVGTREDSESSLNLWVGIQEDPKSSLKRIYSLSSRNSRGSWEFLKRLYLIPRTLHERTYMIPRTLREKIHMIPRAVIWEYVLKGMTARTLLERKYIWFLVLSLREYRWFLILFWREYIWFLVLDVSYSQDPESRQALKT